VGNKKSLSWVHWHVKKQQQENYTYFLASSAVRYIQTTKR
jgi:hypothetical protein